MTALLLLAAAPGSAPAQTSETIEVHIPYTQFTLENGLNVLVHEDRTVPVVSVNVWYHVGSKNERPGRTGFAHLFEHVMFEGSANVAEGEFDDLLEAAGGVNNGSTSQDRTNYWENVPSSALELALWLEADRMGFLLESMDAGKLDVQRDVVMNERRQSYENRPYGLAWETLLAHLYPPGHPYHHPVIGSMEDLAAASLDDVGDFFRTYYSPSNASVAVAGDVSTRRVRELVERYFGDLPAGPPKPEVEVAPVALEADDFVVLEDRVQLPRLYMAWHTPEVFTDGDAHLELLANVLSSGKTSRLHRRLVYEERVAQSVSAFQSGGEATSTFMILVTARPDVGLEQLETAVREELDRLVAGAVRPEEMERASNQIEADFVSRLERVGGFGGKADRLNEYFFFTGDPGFVRRDLARYREADADDVRTAAERYLTEAHAVVLSVVPEGRTELSAVAPADGTEER